MSAPVFLAPTPAEAEAYAQCLVFDHQRFLERVAGRSGLLVPSDAAAHDAANAIVEAAIARGAGFDRAALMVGRAA